MKILQVIPYFTPKRGGDVNAMFNLSKQLVKRGHDCTIITTDFEFDKEYAESVKEVGVTIIPFHCIANIKLFLISPSMRKWLRTNVKDFDIIHMHDFRSYQNNIVHHYAQKYGVPYVLQPHGSVLRIMVKRRLKRLYDMLWGYKLLRDASKAIALTKTEVDQCKSMRVSEDKIEVVPNGIELSEFENLPPRGEFRRKYGLDDNQKIILYLGRIHVTKCLDLLVKAFTNLLNDFNGARLVIVGPDDGYLPALKQLINELKMEERVLSTGPLYGREKLKAYVDADVFVNPRADEIFGLVFLEAFACSTPVICSKGCGIADVIDGQAGLAVSHDKDQLKNAILHMLSDDKMRQKFSEQGKALVREQFSWSKIAGQVEELYVSCLPSVGQEEFRDGRKRVL